MAIFNRGGCGNCHIIPGVPGADGTVGPDLSQLGKVAGTRRKGVAAKDYLRESIVDPDAFIAPPSAEGEEYSAGVMQTQFAKTLSEQDLDTLVEYLASLGVDGRVATPLIEMPRVAIPIKRPAESVQEPFQPLPGKQPSDAQLVLGKYLFFDRRLSNNNSLSCANCHQPEQAFADGEPTSRGYPSTKLFRNTPSLLNVSFARSLYWDGRMSGSDLASVVRDHLTEAHFMSADGRLLVERMKQVPEYVELFKQAYNSEPLFGKILDSVAAYVGSLNSPAIPFDRFRSGDNAALSPAAQAGWKLFEGKAGCVRCHTGALFTDGQFHRLGVSNPPGWLGDFEQQITFRRFFRVLGTPNYKRLRNDPGHYVIGFSERDLGKFRTPGLREVGRTAPYMHNGSLATLEDVIDFYNAGGGPKQTAGLEPLNLSADERAQLVVFLKTLSSPSVQIDLPELPGYALLPLGGNAPPRSEDTFSPNLAARAPRPLAPLPDATSPPDNPTTAEKVELGRLLYFDPRMSADGAVSCNTCHPSNTGYTARTAISVGGTGTSHWRNSSTIYNVAYYEKFNWDGARPSIEKQNDGAWSGAVAGNLDSELAEERLAQIPVYVERFRKVFGNPTPTWDDALRAVAAYQRTLVSRNVPFDRFLRGDKAAISDSAQRGYQLFLGQAGCIRCHDGPLASDDDYHGLGVPQNPTFLTSPLKQISFRYEQVSKGVPRTIYETVSDDLGLYYVTKRTGDMGRFRTPSLRELVHTAPYMHNGVFASLDEVVEFYNTGGGTLPNKSPLLKPLELSDEQRSDLVEFLKSLSGDLQAEQPPKLPPYGKYSSPGEPSHD